MARKILLFLIIVTSCFNLAIAKEKNIDLKNLYGPRLYGVDIDIKYAFQRKTGVKWDQSTYAQREAFLDQYTREKMIQDEALRVEAKANRQKERQETRQKAIEARAKRLKDKAIAKEEARLMKEERDRINAVYRKHRDIKKAALRKSKSK